MKILSANARWLWLGAGIALAALFYFGLGYLANALTHESTDDAFIEGHIVSIAPKVSGQLVSVHVTDNQTVKKGDLLVEIDPRDYEMRVKQKRAAAETSDANLKSVISAFDLMKAKVDTAEAGAKQARAQAEASRAIADRTESDLKRSEQLTKQGAISDQEFDNARAAARQAEANGKADEQNAEEEASKVVEAKAQLRAAETVVAMAKSQIQQSQTDINAAELDLSYTKIIAPCDGRVTRKMAEAGSYVQTGQVLMTLVPPDVWVTANFKETQLTEMHPDQPAEIEIEAFPGRSFRGHVDSIQAGSGARFSLLPPENAVGNFVKVVQRVPVKIVFDEAVDAGHVIGPGMSVVPSVWVKDYTIPRWARVLAALGLAAGVVGLLKVVLSRGNHKRRSKPEG